MRELADSTRVTPTDWRTRRIALIYNPASGQQPARRTALIARITDVFRQEGVEINVVPTYAANTAGLLAREAVERGCDTVIACGGDGTVHEILQTMAGSETALGIIPLGTANALAADLGLPPNPVRAARKLLDSAPERISVGRVRFIDQQGAPDSRYFVVAAGVGADGYFFAHVDSRLKQRLGYAHYLIEALRLWAIHTFPMYRATFTEAPDSKQHTADVSQVLAVRITNFGGLVRHLVPDASIRKSTLHAVAFKTRSRIDYLRFMAAVWFRRHKYAAPVELVDCTRIECAALPGASEPVYVEADGEFLGTLPVTMEIVPNALTLLVPRNRAAIPTR
jgi:YegS/Rv2252/BmrU family lipid kinase